MSERASPCRQQPFTKREALFKFFRLSPCVLISESCNFNSRLLPSWKWLDVFLPAEDPLSVHILFYAGKAEVFVALDISYVVCEGSREQCSTWGLGWRSG